MKQLIPGQLIGNYRLIRELGAGAVGAVYEVEHQNLKVRYALKVFTFMGGSAELLRKRFEAEGRVLARLKHQNLARVIDLGFDDGLGVNYFVMDLVLSQSGEPKSLASVEPGSVDEDQIAIWFAELCEALTYIHSQGIIHRDIKLDNALVNAEGHIILSDFGISRFVDPDLKKVVNVTATMVLPAGKIVMGTPAYMAPELLSGEEASVASDVYALGVLVFRLLTSVWYDPTLAPRECAEPKTAIDSIRLLKMFDLPWVNVLPKMLDNDPTKRPKNLRELPGKLHGHIIPRWWKHVALFLGVMMLIAGTLMCWDGFIHRGKEDVFIECFGVDGVFDGGDK